MKLYKIKQNKTKKQSATFSIETVDKTPNRCNAIVEMKDLFVVRPQAMADFQAHADVGNPTSDTRSLMSNLAVRLSLEASRDRRA